jgi:hypothetical protein
MLVGFQNSECKYVECSCSEALKLMSARPKNKIGEKIRLKEQREIVFHIIVESESSNFDVGSLCDLLD